MWTVFVIFFTLKLNAVNLDVRNFYIFNFKTIFSQFVIIQRTVRNYQMENFRNCPIPGKMIPPIWANLSFYKAGYDKIGINATVIINEQIDGDIVLVVEPARCSPDMITCTKPSSTKYRGMCDKLKDKRSFIYSVLGKFSPPFLCPLKAGNYTLPETSVDLSIVSKFSLDKQVYLPTLKLVSSNIGSKTKKLILCMQFEAKVSIARIKP
jgi:hypothetical protein